MNIPEPRKKRFWFTLAELIVVVAILAILATIAFIALSGYSKDAAESSTKTNVRSVYSAISSESAATWNSPRYYVVHDTWAALSWAVIRFANWWSNVVLTGGDWNEAGTNYSAGNPDWSKLKLNPDKFRTALPGDWALDTYALDSSRPIVGAADGSLFQTGGKPRTVSYLQVVGIRSSGNAFVVGNYPVTTPGNPEGLVKDPTTLSFTAAILDGAVASCSAVACPTAGSCWVSHWATTASAPSTDLCSTGFPSAVAGNWPWNWSCFWTNGWPDSSCSSNASYPYYAIKQHRGYNDIWRRVSWSTYVLLSGSCAWTQRTYSVIKSGSEGAIYSSGCNESASWVGCQDGNSSWTSCP